MGFNRLGIKLVYLLLLMALLGACGPERTVYVVVTATPAPSSSSAESERAADDAADDDALPSALQVEGNEPQPTSEPLPTSEPQPTSEPAATQPESALTDQLAGSQMGRIAIMGPMGPSQALQSFVANLDGSGLTWVSEEFGEGYFPSLSPDGQQLLFVANTNVDPEIFVVDVATNVATNLTDQAGFDNQPVWSPDGTQIAFVTNREGGNVDLWLMNADGSNARRLASTPGDDNLGSWSPDSQKIVYSNKDEVGESLWIVDVTSGESTRLTESQDGGDSAPTWSPDGERIAFYSAPTGGLPNVFTIRPDGSERQQVSDGSAPALFPIWGPEGQQLIYTLVENERYSLYMHDLESNQERVIPNVEGFATTWRANEQLLADTGFTQGPQQSDVEVNPQVLEAAYRKGSPDAPVTIIEFSDYQCPFCQRWFNDTYPQLQPYIEDGTVQLIFVDFPLNIHPEAPAAHQAARCAGEFNGNDGYWTMHDALFNSLSRWSGQADIAAILKEVADEAELDGAAIQTCVESERYKEQVDAGLNEGIRLGVSGTPTFFINGTRLVGAQPWSAFEPFITQASNAPSND